MEITKHIIELYKKVATTLPSDVKAALSKAYENKEESTTAKNTLSAINKNIELAENESKAICQDTGTPYFFVKYPIALSQLEVKKQIIEATKIASKEIPLRPNSVETLRGKTESDNVGVGIPVFYLEEWEKHDLQIQLILKGGGSENMGRTYSLPDTTLGAGRDIHGVRKCIIDAVFQAQGKACPPGILGIAVGSPKDAVARLAKEQLLRKLDDRNPVRELDRFEKDITAELNTLGIGPAGLGGKTTILGAKIAFMHRHPACYFVEIAYSCWATRRGTLTINEVGEVVYD